MRGEGPKKVERFEWHYIEMEYFIKNLYGQEWEGGAAMGFPAQDTYQNVTVKGVSAEPVDWIDENGKEIRCHLVGDNTYDEAKLIMEKFKAEGMPREEYADPGLELMLNWLCHEGHIPAGDYCIQIWW